MTTTENAEFFRYQRLFGITDDGVQMKVTVIIDSVGRVRSSSIQLRAVDGPTPVTAHPSLWSKAFTLTPSIIGDDEFGGGAA